jgi:hypothetical protein
VKMEIWVLEGSSRSWSAVCLVYVVSRVEWRIGWDGRGKITYPEPVVLKVDAGSGFGDVDVCVSGHALRFIGVGWALGYLETGSLCATDARVDIPETRASGRVQVVLDDLSAGGRALSSDDHV